jgi:uroporphyrin-III C-methyltransferase
MRNAGMVYLVGAGPGDPGLITVRGLACLRQAQVVMYDRLIHPDLLREAPATAECVDVGKMPHDHPYPQSTINTLLIARARQGKTVVRLKGGDPFVFGRGGEECQALAAAGIPCEVIPGVSSATAVPACAGIPVTHRAYASAFAVVTGHTAGLHAIDWRPLASIDTLVVLMGLGHLADIAQQIMRHGRAPDTPVAVIHAGTTCAQTVVQGTLQDIARRARGMQPPTTIVIGHVVNLRQLLATQPPWLSQTDISAQSAASAHAVTTALTG